MKQPRILLGFTVLLAAAAVPTPAASAPTPAEVPLAKVNDEAITGADLQADFTRRHGGHQKFLMGVPETRSFLEIVIDDRLLIQEAYRLDLQDSDPVKRQTAEFAERKATEYLVRKEIDEKARPTEGEVRRTWQERTGTLYLARRIVVATRAEAEAVAYALAAGGNFDDLARQCSTDESRERGGQTDWFGWGAMEADWEAVVLAMRPGDTTGPFETREGWEIVQLGAAEPVELPEYSPAAPKIQGILKKRQREAARAALSELLWSKYHVRLADVPLTPEGLRDALVKDAQAPIATWDGGSLAIGKFVSAVDWAPLTTVSPGRFRWEILDRLQDVVNADLVRREAMARGLDRVPEIAEAIKRYREDRMLGALYAGYVLKGVTVTEEERRAYYEQHKQELTAAGKRRVSHLVVRTQQEAEELREQVEAGAAFADLVRAQSIDKTTASKGGDLGWITPGEAKGELEAVLTLERGEVSQPIESRYGWHLFLVSAVEPPQAMTYEEAKPMIERKLMEKKQRAKRIEWCAKLRSEAKISISDSAIQKFVDSATPKS